MEEQIAVIPVKGIPLISQGSDIAALIANALDENEISLKERDVLVIAHSIVSKAEGRVLCSSDIKPSTRAIEIAANNGFDADHVEVALREASLVLREERALITETNGGHICNFSGVDRSNAPQGCFIMLPQNPDQSAESIRQHLEKTYGKKIGVIISDTEGRPWRKGAVNIAIGCSGINAFKHNEGKLDLYSRTLHSSLVCQVDEIAAAAELVMGQADEGIPVAIVRGYEFETGSERASDIHRKREENLFL